MMSIQKINPSTVILFLMMAAVSALRVVFNLSHETFLLANFSPIGAMALFGGSYFDKRWKAFGFPLFSLFLSDFILHQTVFKTYGYGFLYGSWYWVYGAFALITLAGRWILAKRTVGRFLLSVVVCVFIHWILTDFGIWLGSKTYAQNLGGFVDCLVAAIPFEWKFFAGTTIYGLILFGAFGWMQQRYPVLARNILNSKTVYISY